MTEPLFIEPTAVWEKTAAETELPEDPNRWPQAILQELYKQVPYVSDFEPHIEMDRVDAERGYAFGHVEVMNRTEAQQGTTKAQMQSAGIRQARIPVVVKENKLQPFDLLITDDSKMMPLTEERLRQAIFRPQMFDVAAETPGDQSLIAQLYPPYRQNFGFGQGGRTFSPGLGKQGSALEEYLEREDLTEKNASAMDDYFRGQHRHGRLGKVSQTTTAQAGALDRFIEKNAALRSPVEPTRVKRASLLHAILPSISGGDHQVFQRALAEPVTRNLFMKNAHATCEAVQLLLDYDPSAHSAEKTAAALAGLVQPSVVQVSRVGGGYRVKTAHHQVWEPVERQVGRGDVVGLLGEKVALAVDQHGSVTVNSGAAAVARLDALLARSGPVAKPGFYKTRDADGNEHTGKIIPHLIDIDGKSRPLSLFTNGKVMAVQSAMMGAFLGELDHLPTARLPRGRGFFFNGGPDGLRATIPMTCHGSTRVAGQPIDIDAETFDGRPVTISVQAGIQKILHNGDKMLVPQSWAWSPLGAARPVDLAQTRKDLHKHAELDDVYGSVAVRCSAPGCFSLGGPLVDKVAHAQREMVNTDEALFMLAGFGVAPEQAIAKLGEASSQREPVLVRATRTLTTRQDAEETAHKQASAHDFPALKRQLFKEAAMLPDAASVDTVLSLGFINPENISTFVGYVPEIERAQNNMCELLLAARLGLKDITVGALEKAVKMTEEVLQGLKVLAFQK